MTGGFQASYESFAIFSRLTGYDKRTTALAAFVVVPAPRRWELALSIELVGDLSLEQKKFLDARAQLRIL